MIRPVEVADAKRLGRPDVCVIGGGPAGLELSAQLAALGARVVVLEGGRMEFDRQAQDLHRVVTTGRPLAKKDAIFEPHSRHPAATETRVRQYGGSTNVWGGKWKLPDAMDFATRPWIAEHGWPVGVEAFRPFLEEVMRDYGIPNLCAGQEALEAETAARHPRLFPSLMHVEIEPANFGQRLRPALADSGNVEVLLGANVTSLTRDASGSRVVIATFRSLDGIEGTLEADQFVICTGGLEAPRLLLLSGGMGNEGGWVGRGYMDHPKVECGHFRAASRAAARVWPLAPRGAEGGFTYAVWGLPLDEQRRLGTGNHFVMLRPLPRPKRRSWGSIRERFLGGATHGAILQTEMRPGSESHVSLSSERDAFGIPLPALHWALTGRESAGAVEMFFPAMVKELADAGLGRLSVRRGGISLGDFSHSSHPVGTARMAADPRHGVVDRDCRVFGVENCYVCGSAVFPISGSANPTLLILALARRLARRLSSRV